MAENYFIRNLETQKLELHFEKSAYQALNDDQKDQIKRYFLWGRNSGCWISRCKEPNLIYAIKTAQDLGLEDAGTSGQRLSFAEMQEIKAEKAEHRAERLESAADRAQKRGDDLQKEYLGNDDISYWTQPIHNTRAGRAFARSRQRVVDNFDKGIVEHSKAAEYRSRAAISKSNAAMEKLQDRSYLVNRIDECNRDIRALERNLANGEGRKVSEETMQHWRERLEAVRDKLQYFTDAMDALGGVKFGKDNIKPGFVVKVAHHGNMIVDSTGPKNFRAHNEISGFSLPYDYGEILEVISDKIKPNAVHPFKVGDSFTLKDKTTHTIIKATDKTVTIQASSGETYRVKPSYRPIPAQGKSMWRLCVGNGWAADIYYRDAQEPDQEMPELKENAIYTPDQFAYLMEHTK